MPAKRRVLFVTVGTTALGAKHLGGLSGDSELLRKQCKDFLEALATAPAPPDLFDKVVSAHEELWSRPHLPIKDYREYTSAEMVSSYYALRVHVIDDLFDPKQDQIVLLSSDTTQGKLSAYVNAALARTHLFSHQADNEDAVIVEPIPGLDATRPGRAFNIANSLKTIWDSHPAAAQTIVNITGGFKGTVPFLTWRCYEVASATHKSTMIYAHERMDHAEVIQFRPDGLDQETMSIIV